MRTTQGPTLGLYEEITYLSLRNRQLRTTNRQHLLYIPLNRHRPITTVPLTKASSTLVRAGPQGVRGLGRDRSK
jgi:hypothetical protein